MAFTQDQIDKAKRVKVTLDALEAVHQSRQVIAHHKALNDLLISVQPDLAPADVSAMGGGTNKTV